MKLQSMAKHGKIRSVRHPIGARGPRIDARALRAIRIQAGFTQVELGKRAKVHYSHISRLESGKRAYPRPRIAHAIADALGCEVSSILAADLLAGN